MKYDDLKTQIVEKAKTQSVLCVVNTKKFASRIYEDLVKQNIKNLFLLSANLIPLHRKQKIEEIKEKLDERVKVILISTQMVEAGVDLDFDTGFREFAPFGSIIQTAGRINRNYKKRDYQDCELLVFELSNHPNLEDGGKKTHPYHDKDMLVDKKDILFDNAFNECEILKKIRLYFDEAIDRTILLDLQSKMKNLEFQSVFDDFEKNFMSKIPNLVPVFVEVENGLIDKYKTAKIDFLRQAREVKDLKQKMEIKTKLKNLEKEMSRYIVEVKEVDVKNQLQPFLDSKEFQDFTNIHVCPFGDIGKRYSYEKGWNGAYWDYGFDEEK